MTAIVCNDPKHLERSPLPGWSTILGESDQPNPQGYLCTACAKQRTIDAVLDRTNGACSITFTLSGQISASALKKYSDGTFVELVSKRMNVLNELTPTERTTLKDILTKLLARVG